MTTLTANEIFRDFNTDGVPGSGPFKPVKAQLREYFTDKVDNGSDAGGGRSVLDYGAAGDGVTDDTAAFAAALADVDAVYAPGGRTYIVSGLQIPSSKRLYGDGMTTILKNPANATANIIRFDSVNSSRLENLMLDGQRSSQTIAPYLDNISMVDSYKITMKGVRSHSAARFGLRIVDSADAANDTRTYIEGCEFSSCGTFPREGGGAFWNKAENIDFIGCSFHGNLYIGAGSFFKMVAETTGNGSQTAFPFYFHILSSADVRVYIANIGTGVVTEKTLTTDFTVTVGDELGGTINMVVAPTSGETLIVYRVPPSGGDIDYETIFELAVDINQNVSFTACSFINNTNGIQLGTVPDLDGTTPPYYAWHTVPADAYDQHFSVVGCAFERNDYYVGILPGNHVVFANNRCHANGLNAVSASLVPQGEYLTITGNLFHGNAGCAIDMGMCRYFTVSGNEFIDCEVFGIELNAVQYGVVSANIFQNCCTGGHVSAPGRCAIKFAIGDFYGIYNECKAILVSDNIVMPGADQTYGILIDAPGGSHTYDEIWIVDNFLKGSGTTRDLQDNSGVGGTNVFYYGNITAQPQDTPNHLPSTTLDILGTGFSNPPTIRGRASASFPNLEMRFVSIGGGGFTFRNSSTLARNFVVASSGSATGWVQASGNIGYSQVEAEGTGSDSDLYLSAKGTGRVHSRQGITSLHDTKGVGYETGAGGAVTQATSRTTGVTLNKVCGAITLVSAAGSTTFASFTVTNSAVAATDTVIVNQKSGTDLYEIHVTAVAAGSFRVTFRTTGGTTTEQPVFNFSVIKAVAA